MPRALPSIPWPRRSPMSRIALRSVLLPVLGVIGVLVIWTVMSETVTRELPSPLRTWQESRRYVLEPFFKDGEMNQGIGRLAFYSLLRVGKGFLLAVAIGTPLGFLLGLSRAFHQSFDPIVQFLRPISPLAWLPLGLVIFQKSEPAAIFTIALCAMWPTVINTAVGVRSISPDHLNVGRVLKLSRAKMLTTIVVPASLPYVFTGYWRSGRTTLISLIAGLLTPDCGDIVLDGARVSGPGPERGVVFQQYSLLPWMTVFDNVALAVDAVSPGMPAAERRRQTEELV